MARERNAVPAAPRPPTCPCCGDPAPSPDSWCPVCAEALDRLSHGIAEILRVWARAPPLFLDPDRVDGATPPGD